MFQGRHAEVDEQQPTSTLDTELRTTASSPLVDYTSATQQFIMAESPGSDEQATLPTAELVKIDSHISLLPPLSRRGYGPGLIIVLPEDAPTYTDGGTVCEDGIPPPLLKWAEEGFAVLEIREAALRDTDSMQNVVDKAVAALEQCKQCRSDGGIGMIGRIIFPFLVLKQTSTPLITC